MTLRLTALAAAAAVLTGCSAGNADTQPAEKGSEIRYEYGVFLGAEPGDLPDMEPYRIIVLDAQYYTSEHIAALKGSGHTVYSYINIGALEDFRPYYDRYEPVTLGAYENWDEERWVDVSRPEWQSFIADELAPAIIAKGVDGFFADNCDVYFNYPTEEIFSGTEALLKSLKAAGGYVSINGGDVFVTEYARRYGSLDGITDAVNQETVFSRLDWDSGRFSENPADEREYFMEYAETVAALGKDVYLLEYTTDRSLIERIAGYCGGKGFRYYAADSVELLIPKDGSGSQPVRK